MQVIINDLMQILEITDIKYFGIAVVICIGLLIYFKIK